MVCSTSGTDKPEEFCEPLDVVVVMVGGVKGSHIEAASLESLYPSCETSMLVSTAWIN